MDQPTLLHQLREVAALHGRCRRIEEQRASLPLPVALVRREEEHLVSGDRAAYVRAPLVLDERRRFDLVIRGGVGVVEEGVGIEDPVAEKFVGRAMEFVAAGLGGHVDHAASETPEFRTQVVGLDLEFLHRVLRGHQSGQVDVGHVDRRAVERRRALIRLTAADLVVAPREDVHAGGALHGLALGHDARRQCHEVEHVAAVQGRLGHFPRLDHLAEGRGLRLQQGRLRHDLNDLGHFADLQDRIDANASLDLDRDRPLRELLEAFGPRFQPILSRHEIDEPE